MSIHTQKRGVEQMESYQKRSTKKTHLQAKKTRFSRRMMVGFLASLLLLTMIIPSAVLADSSNGGGR
jgi:predicted NACHT family NTPase